MSCAGRNGRQLSNSPYNNKIIYSEWNVNCDETRLCNCFERDNGYYMVLYDLETIYTCRQLH